MSICKSVKLHQSVYMHMLDSTNVSAHKMFLLLSNTFLFQMKMNDFAVSD